MVVDQAVRDPVIALLTHRIAKMFKRLLFGLRRYDAFDIALQIFHGDARRSRAAETMGAIRAYAPDQQPWKAHYKPGLLISGLQGEMVVFLAQNQRHLVR